MAGSRKPELIVSLHDVTPVHAARLDRAEALLRTLGIDEVTYLLVPRFHGVPSDDELIELYQQCDLFALPNRQVGWDFEGFGIALIEAQACGKAVIAGASGGAPETLRPHETGEVVKPVRNYEAN